MRKSSLSRRPVSLSLLSLLLAASPLVARTLYVSGTGDDAADGAASATALRSLQKAADRAEPGDTVLVGDGIYPDTGDVNASGSAVVKLAKFGRPDAWITFQAAPGAHPVVRPKGWGGISISGAYIIVDGLAVTGDNDSIRLIDGLKEAQNARPNPYFNTNGIVIDGR